MGFFGNFNRAIIGFPLKTYTVIDGVAAVSAAVKAGLKAKAAADTAQDEIVGTLLGLKNGVTRSALQRELKADNLGSYYWLEVEFNPSTMRYTAMNGSFQQQQSVTGDIGSHIAQYNIEAQTNMNFEMYVDSAICLSATTGLSLSSATAFATNLIQGKDFYNIQPVVDGLCALCNDAATQYVIFAWGQIVFYGVLEEVNAEYIMFDVDGKPIRAKVSMSMRQSGTLGKDEQNNAVYSKSNKYWDEVYKKFFGDDGPKKIQLGSSSPTKSMKDFNNILNLK